MRKRILLSLVTVLGSVTLLCLWLLGSPWLTFALIHEQGTTSLVASSRAERLLQHVPENVTVNVFSGGWIDRIMFATRHDRLFANLAPAFMAAAQHSDTPRPDILLSIAARPSLFSNDTLILGDLEGKVLTLHTENAQPITGAIRNHEVLFSISSATAESLPPSVRAQWNELLLQQLAFEHTTPDIVAALSAADSFYVSRNGTGTVLSISGTQATTLNTFASWLTDEARFVQPQQQAFRLPDGTIGYELVPGVPPDARLPNPGSCREPDPSPAPQLWLCNWHEAVSLSTEELREQPHAHPDGWVLHVAPTLYEAALERQHICALPSQPYEHIVCAITGFTILGSSDGFMATVLLK